MRKDNNFFSPDKIKKILRNDNRHLDMTARLLCGLVTGEALFPQFYSKQQNAQALYGLRRYKFVRHSREKGNDKYILTEKGKKKLQNIVVDEIKIKKPKSWDGKWRMVMYDLPVRFTRAREAFRWRLKSLGFFQFQKSAWIYPYACDEEVLFLADFYGVRKYVEILEVGRVLHEQKLKTHFGL